MDAVVSAALQAMADRDWGTLRIRLHPYLRWSAPDGTSIRGRTNVMTMLKSSGPPDAPSSYEIRDGQIYRWIA